MARVSGSTKCCANCQTDFDKGETGCVYIPESKNNEPPVKILEALSIIYGYPTADSPLAANSGSWDHENIVFCDICANFITQFYQTYLEIRKLANAESYILRWITQIHHCVTKAFSKDGISEKVKGGGLSVKPERVSVSKETDESRPPEDVCTEELSGLDEVKIEPEESAWNDSNDYEPLNNETDFTEEHLVTKSALSTPDRDIIGTSLNLPSPQGRKRTRRQDDTDDDTTSTTSKKVKQRLAQQPTMIIEESSPSNTDPDLSPCKFCEKDPCVCQCWCTVCNQKFAESIKLSHHIKSEHGDDGTHKRNLTCPRCVSMDAQTLSIFVNYEDMKKHCSKEHNECINLCTKCGKSFSSEENRREHRHKFHSGSDETQDEIVPSDEPERGELEYHELQDSYQCVHCDKEFDKSHKLTIHYLLHNDRKPQFGCGKCPKIFFRHDTLRRHLPVHTWKKMFNCLNCPKKFERQDHLDRHIISVHDPSHQKMPKPEKKKSEKKKKKKEPKSEEPVQVKLIRKLDSPCELCGKSDCDCLCRCTECSKPFSTCIELCHHIKDVHGDDGTGTHKRTLTCPMCVTDDAKTESIFANYADLRSHIIKEHREIVNWCTSCGKAFRSIDYLTEHRKRVHEGQDGSKTENDSDLDSQLEPGEMVGAEDLERSWSCTHCDQEFKLRHHLRKHLLSHNDMKPKFGCAVCSKSFFRHDSLRRHCHIHTKKDMLTCSECGKKFERQDHLERHMTSRHNPNRVSSQPQSFTCPECNKSFGRNESLRLHMRVHIEAKTHLCPICGKAFREKRLLDQHKITHDPVKPFCCSHCGLTFKRGRHLLDHEKTHDPNQPRPFACQEENCGKKFKKMRDLRNHRVVHSGVKDYTCDLCGRAFNRADNLRAHVRNVHQKQ